MGVHSAVNSIQMVCCNDEIWYHKLCLKKSAFAFMNEFECPSCGNLDAFQENMLLNGIYVPKGDYLPNYDSVEEIELEEMLPAPKRRRVHKNWILERSFANKKEAMDAIKLEKCWSKYYTNNSSAGVRENFRCNAMKFRGKQCAAGRYLLFDSKSSAVHLYRSEEDHSHDDDECLKNSVNKIPAETEAEIRRLFDMHTKPKAILYNLVLNEKFVAPTKARLVTLLTKIRKEKFGAEKLNFGTLHKWLEECSNIPLDETDPFIVNFDIKIDDSNDENNEFRFFASSKRLLKTAVGIEILCTDATYKLNWQGFPVLLVGTTDSNRKFHLIGMCVSTHERSVDFEFIFRTVKNAIFDLFEAELKPDCVIADAAFAISNGYGKVFGDDSNVIMCWAHLRRAVAKKVCEFIRDKKQQNAFLFDLDKLQLSRSPEIFKFAAELFIEKWRAVSNDLAQYFGDEWITHHQNWYEGFRKKTPSTNNALESFNRVIKDEQTFRERLDISQFRFVLFNAIKQSSIEYVTGLNAINTGNPDIPLKLWTAGYNFARSNVKITSSKHGNRTMYSIPLSDEYNDEPPDSWIVFKDYRDSLNIAHTTFRTPVTTANWANGECDCSDFFKLYMCEHVIGVALRLKCLTVPLEAKTIPIGQKRKRGRPAKSKPALQKQ